MDEMKDVNVEKTIDNESEKKYEKNLKVDDNQKSVHQD